MFNTSKKLLLGVLALCIVSLSATAEEQSYRQAHDITEEEWDMTREKSHEYNSCLKQEMVTSVETATDARQVADQVLEICSVHLIEMQEKMDENNIQPQFTQRFVYNVKNKAARQMLGAIMILMAQKQATNEDTGPQTTVGVTVENEQP